VPPENNARFATGIRQMPAFTWHDSALYVVMQPRSARRVVALLIHRQGQCRAGLRGMYRVTQGSDAGWRFCFYDYTQKKLVLNAECA